MSQALIDISNLCWHPDGRPVLENISLRSDARRIGIVGRNGSGKTSLARLMAGLIAPDEGEVLINGAAVARDRRRALGQVGIVFQNPDHQIIFPTVEEEIAFGLKQMGQTPAEASAGVQNVLRRFDKSHWADAAIHQLSQGQRQLVCLMAVLAMAPRVIILDEPFAGLDIPTVRQLERFLAGLDETLVQITHAPDALRDYDRVLWIEGGRLRGDGPADTVLAEFTEAMLQIGDGDDLSHLAG